MKLGLHTVRDLRRLALVTDIEWMGHALSGLLPSHVDSSGREF